MLTVLLIFLIKSFFIMSSRTLRYKQAQPVYGHSKHEIDYWIKYLSDNKLVIPVVPPAPPETLSYEYNQTESTFTSSGILAHYGLSQPSYLTTYAIPPVTPSDTVRYYFSSSVESDVILTAGLYHFFYFRPDGNGTEYIHATAASLDGQQTVIKRQISTAIVYNLNFSTYFRRGIIGPRAVVLSPVYIQIQKIQ